MKVNREKAVVAYAGKIKFLEYGFYKGKKGFTLRLHAKSKAKTKARVRELTNRRTINYYEKWKVDLKRCGRLGELIQAGRHGNIPPGR